MARIISDRNKSYETWKSAIAGMIHIQQFDSKGDLKATLVHGGQKFQILPEERRINQEAVYSPDVDPFLNGQFSPVRLIENDDDTEELLANPNVISDEAIGELFKSKTQAAKLAETVGRVTNPITLGRMLEVARAADATYSQVEMIERRLNEVATGPEVFEVERVVSQRGDEAVRTRAKKSPAPPNPSAGRRGRPLT